MNVLGNRIKKERENLNLSREDLAKRIGVSYSAIAMYEQGNREPNNEILLKMCEIFSCSMDYLTGKSDFKTSDEEFKGTKKKIATNALLEISGGLLNIGLTPNQILQVGDLLLSLDNENSLKELNNIRNSLSDINKKKFDIATDLFYSTIDDGMQFYDLNKFKKKHSTYYMCPVYGQISAGEPNWAEENIEGSLPIDPNLMDIINPEEYFFLRVNGESMNNVVKNGAFALIHKQDMVENGEIAVVLVNGYSATLKRFTKKGDVVVLEPDSSDPSFKTQIYDKTTPVQILGKYVGKMEINK